MTKLNFAIVGTQKAGSTFIHRNLREHPSVFMPDGEVPYFEDPDFGGENSLESYFPKNCGKILGIKRPNYFEKKEVPKRLIKNNPNIKVIIFLRNPTERAISGYYHGMKMGFLPISDINVNLLKIVNGDEDFLNSYPYGRELINHGYYSVHLKNFLKYFNRNNIYVGFVEDIKLNPLLTIQNLYRFLKISDNFIPSFLQERPMASIYSPTRLKFRQFIASSTNTYSSNGLRIHKKNGIVYYIFRITLLAFDRLILRYIFHGKKSKISNILKKNLIINYKADIEELEQILNKDLTNWYK